MKKIKWIIACTLVAAAVGIYLYMTLFLFVKANTP